MTTQHVPRRVALALGGLSGLALLSACSQPESPSSPAAPTEGSTMSTTPAAGSAPAGIETIDLNQKVPEAVAAFESAAKAKQLTVFATIDHAAGAQKAGLELRPTTLVIVGNAAGGTPLMADQQLMGLVLPLRVLFWEDEQGRTHASYESLDALAERFGLGEASAQAREKISQLLPALIGQAKG